MEIANVQYYSWAFGNREGLLPTREQIGRFIEIVEAARERLKGRFRIDFVLPDYYAKYSKPCMNGSGRQQILIDPAGRVLPSHAASMIPGLEFFQALAHSLRWIWEDSPAFNQFWDEAWMPDPCRTCERACATSVGAGVRRFYSLSMAPRRIPFARPRTP